MLDWFTTIPVILIICGIILLVIAIILFIVGSKKGKKELKQMVDFSANSSTVDNSVSAIAGNNLSISPVETVVENNPSISTIENVTTTPSTMDFNVSEQPVINIPEPEVVSTIDEKPVETIVPQVVEPIVETNEQSVPIYGGTEPIYNFTAPSDKPVTIYGGNDPLEATQTLPKVEEHHLPYGGVSPDAKIANINQVSVEPLPKVENTNEMSIDENNITTSISDIPEVPVINIPNEEDIDNDSDVVSIEEL